MFLSIWINNWLIVKFDSLQLEVSYIFLNLKRVKSSPFTEEFCYIHPRRVHGLRPDSGSRLPLASSSLGKTQCNCILFRKLASQTTNLQFFFRKQWNAGFVFFFFNSTTKSQCFLFTFPTYLMCRNNLLLLFSCSVVSDSLQHHGLQHARLPCPSPSPGVCSNSRPLGQWCHPTISSSVTPFSSFPQSFPASGSFPLSRLFSSGGQSIGASAPSPVLPKWTPRTEFL